MRSSIVSGLSRNRPALSLGWDESLFAVVGHIRTASEASEIIDAAFPGHVMHLVDERPQLAFMPKSRHEAEFLGGFGRQGGFDGPEPLSIILGRLPPDREAWVFAGDLSTAIPALGELASTRVRLLVVTSDDQIDATFQRDRNARSWTPARFCLGAIETPFVALFPEAARHTRSLLTAAERSRKPLIIIGGSGRMLKRRVPPTLAPATAMPLPATNLARDLMTDNVFAAEKHDDRSWLWLGPHPTARFALGRLPDGARRIVVDFIPSPLHDSLETTLKFELDGLAWPHELTRGYDGSGKATLNLAAERSASMILGVACSSRHSIAGDERILRVCIRCIEVWP